MLDLMAKVFGAGAQASAVLQSSIGNSQVESRLRTTSKCIQSCPDLENVKFVGP